MKRFTNILLSILLATIAILCLSGIVYWAEVLNGTSHKIYVHQGMKACHCGNNNVVDSLAIYNGNITVYFNDGKSKGTTEHYATWIDTIKIKTFLK